MPIATGTELCHSASLGTVIGEQPYLIGAMSDRPLDESQQRKIDHLDLCTSLDVEARTKTTLFEEVEFLHQSLPELDLEAIDLSTRIAGKILRAPLVISGMTGGVERAIGINRCLAEAAERHGIGFGLGSQRPMLLDPRNTLGFLVRDVAPDTLVLANLGVVQAKHVETAEVQELVERVGADALALHLNPAQEIIQEGGDTDFCGCIDAIARLHTELDVPIIVKETGAGIGPPAQARLKQAGVRWLDVSGAGGTTWIGVEALRSEPGRAQLGALLWDWGTPTAVALMTAVEQGFDCIASGGIRDGLDLAKAVALGAKAVGMALPFLRAFATGGEEAVDQLVEDLVRSLRAVMLLTGSRSLADLRTTPLVFGPKLSNWRRQIANLRPTK